MSIIYNVTVKVDTSIANAWLEWLLQDHIPNVMASQCFTSYKVVRLLEVDDTEGPTYAIQYTAPSMQEYTRYLNCFAADLRQKSIGKWGDHFIAFHTLMEIVK